MEERSLMVSGGGGMRKASVHKVAEEATSNKQMVRERGIQTRGQQVFYRGNVDERAVIAERTERRKPGQHDLGQITRSDAADIGYSPCLSG